MFCFKYFFTKITYITVTIHFAIFLCLFQIINPVHVLYPINYKRSSTSIQEVDVGSTAILLIFEDLEFNHTV